MKAYPVNVLCAVMRVSRSGFYDYLDRFKNPKDRPDETALKREIKEIFDKSRGSYGSRRIVKQLIKEDHHIGRYKVRRIMRQLELRVKIPKRFKLTTDSRHSFPVAANILDRNFDVHARTRSGQRISVTYGPLKVGFTWRLSWTCIPDRSLGGP